MYTLWVDMRFRWSQYRDALWAKKVRKKVRRRDKYTNWQDLCFLAREYGALRGKAKTRRDRIRRDKLRDRMHEIVPFLLAKRVRLVASFINDLRSKPFPLSDIGTEGVLFKFLDYNDWAYANGLCGAWWSIKFADGRKVAALAEEIELL